MNSPYKGKFRVSQQFKDSAHDGLDLVGVDSKNIYSTIDGIVEFAGWESALNHKKGFGKYVRIKQNGSADRYYFGHLSSIKVKKGQVVYKGTLIGIEGSTGKSTGSHCHYCARGNSSKAQIRDIVKLSGIPNKIGSYENEEEKLPAISYYPQYGGKTLSLVDALKSLNINSAFANRKKIANANGIKSYLGTSKQNTTLLNLLKKGKLIKP